MRSFSLALLVFLTLVGATPAAASDADVLKQFGMLGRQALNCAGPASKSNPHVTYAVSSQGKVTRILKVDPELDGTFPMRKLRMLGPDTMQFDETGRRSDFTITIARIGGKFRSWRSVGADGKVLIEDGKFVSSGSPTLAFEPCRN